LVNQRRDHYRVEKLQPLWTLPLSLLRRPDPRPPSTGGTGGRRRRPQTLNF